MVQAGHDTKTLLSEPTPLSCCVSIHMSVPPSACWSLSKFLIHTASMPLASSPQTLSAQEELCEPMLALNSLGAVATKKE